VQHDEEPRGTKRVHTFPRPLRVLHRSTTPHSMPLTVFDCKGISAIRRERIEAAAEAGWEVEGTPVPRNSRDGRLARSIRLCWAKRFCGRHRHVSAALVRWIERWFNTRCRYETLKLFRRDERLRSWKERYA
jgi:hypothetical protein